MKFFKFGLASLLSCLLMQTSHAQAPAAPLSLEEVCKQTLCRKPDFKLYIDATHQYENEPETPLPVLLENEFVTVYPGETIFIEASIVNGSVKLEQAVSSNKHPERTLVFKFAQMKKQKDMMLEVENPFTDDIKFKMEFMRIDSGKLFATSSCPVRGKLKLFEHWPYPIYQLLISQAKVLTASDKRVCN